MRVIDLSVPLADERAWEPRFMRSHVKRQSHRFGLLAIWWLFRITPKYLRGGLGWSNETIVLSTHGTTHVDAPWHYAPTSEGRPARTIDQLPPGVVLRRWRRARFPPQGARRGHRGRRVGGGAGADRLCPQAR